MKPETTETLFAFLIGFNVLKIWLLNICFFHEPAILTHIKYFLID
jgi:hypothetical protein